MHTYEVIVVIFFFPWLLSEVYSSGKSQTLRKINCFSLQKQMKFCFLIDRKNGRKKARKRERGKKRWAFIVFSVIIFEAIISQGLSYFFILFCWIWRFHSLMSQVVESFAVIYPTVYFMECFNSEVPFIRCESFDLSFVFLCENRLLVWGDDQQ